MPAPQHPSHQHPPHQPPCVPSHLAPQLSPQLPLPLAPHPPAPEIIGLHQVPSVQPAKSPLGTAIADQSWHLLREDAQLALAQGALRHAAETLAHHAEMLAREMENGTLMDQGGPEALRLFAAVIRTGQHTAFGPDFSA